MSGLELCAQLKVNPRLKLIPVIFVSGYHSLENKREAERLGAVDFIEKPISLLRFLACIMGQLKLKMNGEREFGSCGRWRRIDSGSPSPSLAARQL